MRKENCALTKAASIFPVRRQGEMLAQGFWIYYSTLPPISHCLVKCHWKFSCVRIICLVRKTTMCYYFEVVPADLKEARPFSTHESLQSLTAVADILGFNVGVRWTPQLRPIASELLRTPHCNCYTWGAYGHCTRKFPPQTDPFQSQPKKASLVWPEACVLHLGLGVLWVEHPLA